MCLQAPCQVRSPATCPVNPVTPAALIKNKLQGKTHLRNKLIKKAVIGDGSVLISSSGHHFSPPFSIFPSTAQAQPWKARKMTSEQLFRSLPYTVVETYCSQKDLSTEASALILQADCTQSTNLYFFLLLSPLGRY